MSPSFLLKGFEVELFTGRADGTVVGVSADAARALNGFATEPDQRNLEYITPPDADYRRQLRWLLEPRLALRRWLSERELTVLPGSTLSLGDSSRFVRSNPGNPYHAFIEATYGTRVVTASVHINLGITAMEPLFACCRLLRCEAALFLALSASSPFLDGRSTGAHSQRWLQFPLTPEQVPLFLDHAHYVRWLESMLASGAMRNERHLWTSVRPNGERRPYDLNRLELRICDLVAEPDLLLAITALLELRLLTLLEQGDAHDPLRASRFTPEELAQLADTNDSRAAADSLDAQLVHWQDGRSIRAREWIAQLLAQLAPLAAELGLEGTLAPLEPLLQRGNAAMRWLQAVNGGESIASVLQREIRWLDQRDATLAMGLPGTPSVPLG
ncbi:glutamate--cysteine ligase [Synechococcus sp. RSCCF101]|uniref:glutamate--cysteine ligase n=1 Tax=Synechococcus sp. RSCCF101 TaxID=2511069 RepID=UPI001246E605|nr:glutamate--cysteine ligase [Synechococcus sp. RSCCF101]QEY32153.1 glutamate--cysteine ligase [Synechococcus sp. RSCCF101]